jgi:drug/metabolite transporter (DMT)-like permease
MAAMIGFTVVANLLMKAGAAATEESASFATTLLDWRTLVGLASFAAAACVYVLVLRWLPLNVAQSFAAAQFIAVVLASAFVLSEPIELGQWAGIALIAAGIFTVGWATR